MAPGARRRRGETAVPSASAKEAGRAPPGGRGAERKRGERSLLRATPRDPPHARHPRCPLRPGRGPKRRRDVTIAPRGFRRFLWFLRGSVGLWCSAGFYCPGGNNDARPFSALETRPRTAARPRPMASTVLRGRPSPRRGLPRRQSRAKRSATPRTRGTRPRRGARLLMPISRTTTVGARRAPPSGRPQGRHPRLPVPSPRSTSSSRDRRREPRAPGVRRGPSPPPERAAHRRTAPRLRARVQDADFLAPRPPSPTLRLPPPDDSPNHLPEYTTLPPARIHDDNHTLGPAPAPVPAPSARRGPRRSPSAASPSSSDDDRRASSRSSSQSASSHDTRRGLEDRSHSDADARGEVRARTSSTRMIPRAPRRPDPGRVRDRDPDRDRPRRRRPPSPGRSSPRRLPRRSRRHAWTLFSNEWGWRWSFHPRVRTVASRATTNRTGRAAPARVDAPRSRPRALDQIDQTPRTAPWRRRRPDESEREVSSCSSRAKDGDESEGEVSSCSSTGSGTEAGTEANECERVGERVGERARRAARRRIPRASRVHPAARAIARWASE